MPIEPPPTPWQLPLAEAADDTETAGVGADLEPGTLLAAYRSGLFPMRVGRGGPVAWWSPDPRGVLPLDGFRESRSLRRSRRRFEISVAEVDHQDVWQRATLALACVSGDSRHANEVISKAMDYIEDHVDGWVTDVHVEIL